MEAVKNLEKFDEMEKGSYYTIIGAGGDLLEWENGITKLLQERNIGEPKNFYTFTGQQMNMKYNLFGKVAYNDDLTFISFPLDGLNVGALAVFKMQMGDRWFDDIVYNNSEHLKGE